MRFNLSASLKLVNNSQFHKLWCINVRSFSGTIQTDDSVNQSTQPPPAKAASVAENTSTEQRSLHIAVIGVPNVGKSTFINNIVNHRVCPTSAKVHTTRQSNTAICTAGQTQLVFYDTPGLVTQREIRKHHLEQSFKSAYRHAIQHADVIAVLHDASNGWTRKELHPTVLDTLKAYTHLPSFLVLNKIDALKSKRVLLDLIKTLTNDSLTSRRGAQDARQASTATGTDHPAGGNRLNQRETSWSHFSDVFLVSAMTGTGLNELQDYLAGQAKSRQWRFPSDVHTDASPEALIVESVRARLLDYLPQEIPYNLKCELEYYSVEKHVVYTSVQVQCPTTRIERLICGEGNGKLRQITERVTSDLVEMFGQAVSLTISTVSKGKKNTPEAQN
ncbi:GTPase Era, mitochondrial [Drosophila kikkawai]|uniref:GTPase Era, mitochondrial n=1 Tax=Drosophila kikkawai TaxID=30033 RepID=A0A6P4I4J8_DROKI|nr:GTPase Era, mitochondrial [Drosophila kikkawai]